MPTAMILAAGRGERMRPLTDVTPKPLLEVNEKPLLVYHIEKLRKAGIDHIVINYAWLGEKIAAYLGDGSKYGVKIDYSPEGPGGLETLGGIRHALHLLGTEPLLIVNGDVFSEIDYAEAMKADLADAFCYMYLVPNPAHHPEGDFALSSDGHVLAKTNNGKGYTFSGVALYRPECFAKYPDERSPLRIAFNEWIKNGKIKGKLSSAYWCDVGTPERLRDLDSRLRNQSV